MMNWKGLGVADCEFLLLLLLLLSLRSRIRIPEGARNYPAFQNVQTSFESSFLGVKQLKSEVVHSPPSGAEVNNGSSCTSKKVKFGLEHTVKAQRGSRGTTVLLDLGARWGGWLTPRPGRFTPGKETRYPLYRRLGGPQGRCGRVRKISPPPGMKCMGGGTRLSY